MSSAEAVPVWFWKWTPWKLSSVHGRLIGIRVRTYRERKPWGGVVSLHLWFGDISVGRV